MIALENILSQEIVQRLGWTLLHFVWQAAAVALLLAILLRVLRKSTANLRYIIACSALGMVVLLPVITIQLIPVSAPQPAAHIESSPVSIVLPTEEMPAAQDIVLEKPERPKSIAPVSADSWKQRAIETLEPELPYIVSGWLIGVFALSLWHLGGWTQVQRLRRKMVKQVDTSLQSKLKVLAKRLKVNRAVQLMESALVQIPTVVGWLRPVILLPASALTGLSAEQLEAILAHELAHIKRFDYLVNILQTVVEILGFYHPAVWWVSHKIRAERENCCDDLAVSISGDRVCYAMALTSMEEIRAGRGELAVAASGGNLFKRIYRLVGKDSAEKTGFSWVPAVTAILLIAALLIPTAIALSRSETKQSEQKTDEQVEGEKTSSNKNSELSKSTADKTRIVHFPKNQSVGTLKVRDISSDDDSDRGLLSLPGWVLLGQAQSDVSVPAGKELRLEVSEDVTDFSFIADLKPDDLQVLKLSQTGISDEDLDHLKSLSELLGLDLGSTAIKGPGLVHLAPLTSLRKLSLFNTQVSDAGLAHLSTLRSLKYLNLYITQVKGPGLKHLKNLTSLISLDLAATPITNESLVHLAEMTWLKELQLQDTDIGDKGLAYLKPLRSLEELILGNAGLRPDYSPITDEGLVYLKELGSLKNLYLLRTRVTDAGLAHLRNLKNLEALLLTETQITGEGLSFLKDLPKLKYLDLNKTGVSDEFLVYLKNLKSLRTLYMPVENLSQTDLEDLEKALPDCTINGRKTIAATRTPIPDSALTKREKKTDLPTKDKKIESADKLKWLGLAVAMYANDHDDKYPDSLHELRGYLIEEEFEWTLANVEYLGHGKMASDHPDIDYYWDPVDEIFKPAHGKTIAVPPDTVIAYDKMPLAARNGTNVLFNDSHVEFVKPERLKELGISATEILIETKILSVSEDFLQSIGLDANSVHSSDVWSEHLVEDSAAEPNSGTYNLILDGLHISFLLKAVQAHKCAAILSAPQVLTREGKTAEIKILTEENYYISDYTKPNRPSDEPEPKKEKVEIGTRIWLKPDLTPDNENIKLDFNMEIRQLLGYEERKYKGKFIYLIPRTEVVSTEMLCLIPDGKTLLIGGLKITEQVSSAHVLSELPVIGGLFRSRAKIKEQRILLILVKPIINPQQKAKKILPGEADSEEHIKSLARQLLSR